MSCWADQRTWVALARTHRWHPHPSGQATLRLSSLPPPSTTQSLVMSGRDTPNTQDRCPSPHVRALGPNHCRCAQTLVGCALMQRMCRDAFEISLCLQREKKSEKKNPDEHTNRTVDGDDCTALTQCHTASVQQIRLGGFNANMRETSVFRIQRVINHETLGSASNRSRHCQRTENLDKHTEHTIRDHNDNDDTCSYTQHIVLR